jgi:hypothetical protein
METISPFTQIALFNAATHFMLAWSFVRVIEMILKWLGCRHRPKTPENQPQSVAGVCPECCPAERP